MAERVFEGMFILNSDRYTRDPSGVSGQIPAMVEKAGGTMLVSRLWEERRLAYPIKGQRRGTYWLTYFKVDSGKMSELTLQTERNDAVLRHLFLKVDPRIVDTLVEHAKTSEAANLPAETAVKTKAEKPAETGPADKAETAVKTEAEKPAETSPPAKDEE